MQLGTAWEGLLAHTGLCREEGQQEGCSKGKLGPCPCSWAQEGQGLLQQGWWKVPIPEQVFNLSKSSWKAWGAEEQPGTCPSTCAVTQVWCLCCTYPRAQPGCTGPTQHQLGSKTISVKLPFSALFHPNTHGRSLWGCQRCCEVETHPGNNHGYGGQGIPGEQGLSVPP